MLSVASRQIVGRNAVAYVFPSFSQTHRRWLSKERAKKPGDIVFHRLDGQERAHLMTIENGEKVKPTFSAKEMQNRLRKLRECMQDNGIEGALFTSYHNINYYSDFMHCRFGRPYGLAVTPDNSTIISALVDWAQPWRRANTCNNLIYTDWQRDNFWRAVQKELGHVRSKIACEFDEMSLDNVRKFQQAVPNAEMVDISEPAMRLRIIKSEEEIQMTRSIAAVADVGGAAVVQAMKEGAGEYEIALRGTEAMVKSIAEKHPESEFRDTWIWFQTGLNTDGCHNPPTTSKLRKGVISSLNAFPLVAGYYAALERTTFLDHAPDNNLRIWEINCEVHRRGMQLIRPGAKCKDIAEELNEMYRKHDLLDARSFGYGHSFGMICHYYGREAALEFREDVDFVLQPNMIVSMEPMIVIQEGCPGAGGYREHNIILVTETGNENLTGFDFGPDHLIVKN